MTRAPATQEPREDGQLPRRSALAMDAATFRALGHRLVDQLAERLDAIPHGPVTRDAPPSAVRDALDLTGPLPEAGMDPGPLLERTAELLFDHSLFNAHPALLRVHHRVAGSDRDARRFARRGGEPERRRVDAVAGRHRDRVADGAMDRRAHRLPSRLRRAARQRRQHGELRLLPGGARGEARLGRTRARRGRRARDGGSACTPRRRRTRGFRRPRTSAGLGTASIRWIPTDADLRMDVAALRRQIEADKAAGDVPCLVVGTAGSVSTGAVDPLPEIAAVCREHGAVVPRGRRLRRLRGGRCPAPR